MNSKQWYILSGGLLLIGSFFMFMSFPICHYSLDGAGLTSCYIRRYAYAALHIN
tara:strand:+ start:3058 stop:3219 length:162 start_codon:yes stop_codon:yes gene_type:complete